MAAGKCQQTPFEPPRPGSAGCGTGKATRPLAERARENLAGFDVDVQLAPFEEWEGDSKELALVYAATSWHWLDPDVRYRKAHQLLPPDGHLAFWGALHAVPADADPFFAEIQATYDAICESHDGGRTNR